MKITWFGHSCFLLESERGTRVLTDPFNEKVGYSLPEVEADVVTTSHGHYDHNYVQAVKGSFRHIEKPGNFHAADIDIKGIATWHDGEKGARRGANTAFVFSIDGMTVCHCGDLGHIPDEPVLKEIGKVDILLVPVGGIYTIDASQAARLVGLLKPMLTIPMHYKTEALSFELEAVDSFLALQGDYKWAESLQIEVDAGSLGKLPGVLVPTYPGMAAKPSK